MIECARMSDNLLDPKVWVGEIRRDTQTGRTLWVVQRVGDRTAAEWSRADDVGAARAAMKEKLREWAIDD